MASASGSGEQPPNKPIPTSSKDDNAGKHYLADAIDKLKLDNEEKEMFLLMEACREYCIDEERNEHVGDGLTYEDWIEFRKEIKAMNGLRYGQEKIIIGENGLLIKRSNMKPICSFPSCFCTDGTETNKDHRCDQHVGLTKYGTIGLEFDLSEVDIGRYHALVMFVHKPEDDEMDIRRKLVQAFKKSGHVNAIDHRLRKKNRVALANQLGLPDAVLPVRRYKVFNELGDAIYHLGILDQSVFMFVIGMFSKEKYADGFPSGPYKGKKVDLLAGTMRFPQKRTVLQDIEHEQLQTFEFVCCAHPGPGFDGRLKVELFDKIFGGGKHK